MADVTPKFPLWEVSFVCEADSLEGAQAVLRDMIEFAQATEPADWIIREHEIHVYEEPLRWRDRG